MLVDHADMESYLRDGAVCIRGLLDKAWVGRIISAIDRIEQAGRTMEALIHDLLELSRIGQPGEFPALVDPRAVLTQIAAELKRARAGYKTSSSKR